MRFRIGLDRQIPSDHPAAARSERVEESEFYVEKDIEDESFTGYSALLPGTWSQGRTLEDAIENTLTALHGILTVIQRGDAEMPVSRTMSTVPSYGTAEEWFSMTPELGEMPYQKRITGLVACRALCKLGYSTTHNISNHSIIISNKTPKMAISICTKNYFPGERISKPKGFIASIAPALFDIFPTDRPIVLSRTTLRGILFEAKVCFSEFWRAVAQVESDESMK